MENDERARVARRLRALDYSDLQESVICAYLDALCIKGYEDWVGIAHRLADLIEPPTQCPHYRSDRHYCSIHDVPAIDRDALLALADALEDGFGINVELREYARIIREALGVSDD